MFSSFTSQILTSPFTPPSPVISEVLSGRQRSFHFYPLFFSALGEEKSCISGAVAQHPAAAISRTASEWLYRRTTRALDVREWRQIFSIQRDRFGVMDDGRKVYVRVYLRKVGRNGPGDSPSFIDLCEPLWLFFDTQLGNSLDEFRGDIKKKVGAKWTRWFSELYRSMRTSLTLFRYSIRKFGWRVQGRHRKKLGAKWTMLTFRCKSINFYFRRSVRWEILLDEFKLFTHYILFVRSIGQCIWCVPMQLITMGQNGLCRGFGENEYIFRHLLFT